MKKYYFLTMISLFIISATSGQGPTLTFSNTGPIPGDVFTSYNADTTGVLNGTAGANQIWNYANLVINTTTTVMNYVDPSTTPYTSSFPTATVCYTNSPLYSYMKANATEYSILGISSSSYTLIYSDPEILFNYPFSYGQSITDSLKGSYTVSGFSFYRSGTRTTTADGYGTLILPSGTYTNLLRVKVIQDYKDSTSLGSVTYVYNTSYVWYDGVHKNASFRIYNTSNTNGGSTSTARFVTISSVVSAISEINTMKDIIQIYPNPAIDNITVNVPQNALLEITDIKGQLIRSISNCGDETIIDLKDLPGGVYFIKAITKKGIAVNKFVKE
jgi:hypothetical protein